MYLDLQRRARAEGVNTDQLLIRYVLERFLYRVTQTAWQERLILKGGMLLAAFDVRRSTQDVDMAASALEGDATEVASWLHDVAAVEVDDGVEFDLSRLRTDVIREGDPYPGIRVHAAANVATAKLTLKIDVNFGDRIVPDPQQVSYPALLDEPFPILGYPLCAVLGEKIETMVRRAPTLATATSPTWSCSRGGTLSTRTNCSRPSAPPPSTAVPLSTRSPRRSPLSPRIDSGRGDRSADAWVSKTSCPPSSPTSSKKSSASPVRSSTARPPAVPGTQATPAGPNGWLTEPTPTESCLRWAAHRSTIRPRRFVHL